MSAPLHRWWDIGVDPHKLEQSVADEPSFPVFYSVEITLKTVLLIAQSNEPLQIYSPGFLQRSVSFADNVDPTSEYRGVQDDGENGDQHFEKIKAQC